MTSWASGRAPTNDIIISDPGISRIHAALFSQKDGRWTIEELQQAAPRFQERKFEYGHRIGDLLLGRAEK